MTVTVELDQRETELSEAKKAYHTELNRVRENCKHPSLVECWDFHGEPLRICTVCAAEEGGWHAGWQALANRADRKIVKVEKNSEFYRYRKPEGGRYAVSWCYGDKNHPQHECPEKDLTKARGTRCKNYEGFFTSEEHIRSRGG